MDAVADFFRRGWAALAPDAAMRAWALAARPVAEACLADPGHRARWLRCGGTWFAAVNVFPNDANGAVLASGVPPLAGGAVDFIRDVLGHDGLEWDAAQVSVCFPGYPRPWEGESEAAFRFRRDRDGAHVDGLMRGGAARRRRLGEVHGFILGLPLSEVPRAASPLVVWEGSHEVMRRAFVERLGGIAPGDWTGQDLSESYWAARREAFASCARVEVTAPVGGAYVVHRLALHGIAPWGADAGGTPWGADGGNAPRIVAYFRPDPFPGQPPGWWLARP